MKDQKDKLIEVLEDQMIQLSMMSKIELGDDVIDLIKRLKSSIGRNNIEDQYLELLQDILDNGVVKKDRTGTGTLSVFGRTIRHDMKTGFPLLTSKRLYFKGIVTELLWFLRGDTNIKYLVDNGCHIWDGDCYKNYLSNVNNGRIYPNSFTKEEFINKIKTDDEFAKKWGELGPIYGKQWRSWSGNGAPLTMDYKGNVSSYLVKRVDQIQNLINDLKTNPDSRRLMVNAWNVADLPVTDYRTDDELYLDYLKYMKTDLSKEEFLQKLKTDKEFNSRYGRKHITEGKMVLPPCHYGFQVYTRELSGEERLDLLKKKVGDELFNSWVNDLVPFGGGLSEELQSHNIPTRSISLMFNMRSNDVPLGLPFNLASYGLLLEIIGRMVNMVPDELIANLGDAHIYKNQIDGVKEQLTRTPMKLPNLIISDDMIFNGTINEFLGSCDKDSFKLDGYESHPSIKMPLSN